MIDRGLTLESALSQVGETLAVDTRTIEARCLASRFQEMITRAKHHNLDVHSGESCFREPDISQALFGKSLSQQESRWMSTMYRANQRNQMLHWINKQVFRTPGIDYSGFLSIAQEWIPNALVYGTQFQDNTRIRIASIVGNQKALLSIQDPGRGIGLKKLSSLEHEWRQPTPTKHNTKGIGFDSALRGNLLYWPDPSRFGFEIGHFGHRVNILIEKETPPELLAANIRERADMVIAVNDHLAPLAISDGDITQLILGDYESYPDSHDPYGEGLEDYSYVFEMAQLPLLFEEHLSE